jgi:hypothetical protein
MLDFRSARDRAMRRAIETGQMPNMDVIHARQKLDGFEPCFGRSENVCQRAGCRWHDDCAALASFHPQCRLGTSRRMLSQPVSLPASSSARFSSYDAGEDRPEKALAGSNDPAGLRTT